jgi:hypothetical protein
MTSINYDLWQGLNGVNNPCPLGFRLPTESELDQERLSWTPSNAMGAFNSPLKISLAGLRGYSYPNYVFGMGIVGAYWSSSVWDESNSYSLQFDTGSGSTSNILTPSIWSIGLSVRCIKD